MFLLKFYTHCQNSILYGYHNGSIFLDPVSLPSTVAITIVDGKGITADSVPTRKTGQCSNKHAITAFQQ